MQKYIAMDFCEAFDLKKKTVEQQIIRLGIKPIGKERVKGKTSPCNIYDESAYIQLEEYNKKRAFYNEKRAMAKQRPVDNKIYRVSVKEADNYGDFHYYIRHLNLNKQQANQIVNDYRKVGLEAIAIPCVFKNKKIV